jgi:hypothetical protein
MYDTEYRQQNIHIYSVEPVLKLKGIMRVARINWGILLGAQGTYCTKANGDHLDQDHSEQMILGMAR